MKKRNLLLLVLLTLIGLTSCQMNIPGIDENGAAGEVVKSVTVTFEENGGTAVADLLIKDGSKIAKPSNPVNGDLVFGGWYKDAELKEAWDFENDVVKGDTTLYAKWNKQVATEYEEVTYSLDFTDFTTGKFKEESVYSRFTFNTEVEIRTRTKVWTNPDNSEETVEFTKSAKLGGSKSAITVSVPGEGVLSFYIQNGSSGKEYQVVTVTDPSGVATDIEFVGTVASSPIVKIDVEVSEGDYVITRPSGTVDIFLFELVCQVEVSEEVGYEIIDTGKDEYIQGEELDYSDLKVQAVYANGKVDAVTVEDLEINTAMFNADVPGVYPVTVRYKDYPLQSYEVVVYEISELVLGMNAVEKVGNSSAGNGVYYNHSVKQVYALNEELDLTGLTYIVKAEHEGSVKEFITTENISVSAVDTSTAGKKEVVVTYEYCNGSSVSATFTINVVDTAPSIVDGVYQVKVEQEYAGQIGAVVDGYNMFNTIKQALDYLALDVVESASPKHLVIGEGTYNEKLEIEIPYLTITGAGVDKTLVEWDSLYGIDDESGFNHTTDSTATVAVREAALGLIIEEITISNYWNSLERFDEKLGEKYPEHRALALLIQADKVIIRNASLLGYQDTVEFFTGRQYVENTYIAGTTDFIFGTNNTTYFKNCTIHSISNGQEQGGYITAFKGNNKGDGDYVQYGAIFDQCQFTADADVLEAGNTAIGRPWAKYAAVMVMNSELGSHVSLLGSSGAARNERYVSMNALPTDETVKFTEYNNTGAGALAEEVAGMRFVSDEEAANYSDFAVIYGKANGKVTFLDAWDPTKPSYQVDERTYYYFNQEGSPTGTSYTFDTTVTISKGSTYQFGDMLISAENGNVAWNQNANAFNMKAGGFMQFDVEAGTEVMVTTYPGYNPYLINGVATSNDSTFTQYYAEATTVTILSTGDLYIFSVIVTPNAEKPENPVLEQIKVEGLELNYKVGDEVSYEGLVVKAYYSNSAVYTLKDGDYTLDNSAVDNSKAGTYDVVISYQGKEVALTLSFEEANADPAITQNTTLSFSTGDGYNAVVNNPRVTLDGSFRNNGSEYQIKGTIKFMVKAGTIVTVHPYANSQYASFTIGAEGEEGLPTLNTTSVYVAEKDCTIVYTGLDNNYLVSIDIMCPVANETYTFGGGNVASVGNVVVAGSVRDNGDSLQLSEGATIEFVAAAHSKVTITGHSKGYGQLAISVNGELSDVQSNDSGVYVLSIDEAALISITALNVGSEESPAYNKSYIKAVKVDTQLPIEESILVNFGSAGNYKQVEGFDFSNIQIGDNGGNNSQVKNGYMTFIVKAGATVTINGYPGYTSYVFSDGNFVSDEITAQTYEYVAEETVQIRITPVSGNNYFYSISIAYPTVIEEAVTITFGSEGNYKEVEGLNISSIEIRDNGGNNSQIKNGSMSFLVKAGATITINGYPGYTSYKVNAGSLATDEITDQLYSFTVESDLEVVITPVNGNNYFYSISVAYPAVIDEDTTITFGNQGNYKGVDALDISAIEIRDNGGDNSQIKNGSMSFSVKAGATVTINGYPGYTSYNVNAGSLATDEITDQLYSFTVESDLEVVITPVSGNNYFYSIEISYQQQLEPVKYTLDVTTISADGVSDKGAIAEGTKLADHFTVVGTVTQRVKNSATYAIEVGKNNTGALEFTVNQKVVVTITLSSTGGSNTSAFALVDAEGNAIAEATGLTEVTGTSAITVTYTVDAGTYQIVSPQSSYGRGYRIMTVEVESVKA